MKKNITRLLLGLFIGILGSLVCLFLLRNKDGKKLSWKKLFSMHTLTRLSRVYDIIIDGIPDDEQNIVTNVLKALKSANTMYEEMFQVRRLDKFMKFVQDEGFSTTNNEFIMPLVRHTKLGELAKTNNSAVDLGNNLFVTTMEFPDGDKIYICNVADDSEDGSSRRSSRNRDGHGTVALSPGFNMESKLDMFWQFYQGGIFIRSVDQYETADFNEHSENLVIEDLGTIDNKFYGKSNKYLNSFTKKLSRFREHKIQRSYLLLGKPGTGKSTFCVEVSRRISNRVVKISADLFRTFNREDINFIFKCLKPDTVIIDDFDRVYDDMADADMLYFFEQLKVNYNNVTVFCTVNDIKRLGEAMIRPGRFDEIVVFELPDDDDRKIMLESFIKELELEVQPNEAQMKNLVEVTKGFSPAYLREYCLQLKYEPSFKELVRRIKMTKQFVDDHDFGSGDLEDM
jgi:hypothetical protein